MSHLTYIFFSHSAFCFLTKLCGCLCLQSYTCALVECAHVHYSATAPQLLVSPSGAQAATHRNRMLYFENACTGTHARMHCALF